MMRILPGNARHVGEHVLRALEAMDPPADEIVSISRDGLPINGLRRDGRERFFHSRYAAAQEAERLASSAAHAGTVVVLGVGMGHHVTRLVETCRAVVLVEPNPRLLASFLTRVDLGHVPAGRLTIITTPEELGERIRAAYNPSLDGALCTVELPGRVDADPDAFAPVRRALRAAVDEVVGDVATQARHADRWIRNTAVNVARLIALGGSVPSVAGHEHAWTGSTVVVTAAGPSLENHAEWILRNRSSVLVLATDTSLPSLQRLRLEPDLVISIDCQQATYHHYLSALSCPHGVGLELSTPPAVARRCPSHVPLRSQHPFHGLLHSLGLRCPQIDVHGGTVTHSAVALAASLGAAEIVLCGADFSYPAGATYCRGSYVHELFNATSDRLSGSETLHYDFLMARPGLSRERGSGDSTTPLLDRYRSTIESLAATLSVRVYALPGGSRLSFPPPAYRLEEVRPPVRDASEAESDVPSDLLQRALQLVAMVPTSEAAFRARLGSRDAATRLAAATVLPTIHRLRVCGDDRTNDAVIATAVSRIVESLRTGIRLTER